MNIIKTNSIKAKTAVSGLSRHFTGNWKIDLEQPRLSVCPKTKSMFGISECKYFGLRDLFRRLDGANLIRFKNWMRVACTSNLLEPVNINMLCDSGESKSFKIAGFHYASNWGLPNMVLGVIEDVTQKVQEERVALSIINHEMRTPLSVMKLNAQMIQRDSKTYRVSPSEMASNIERHIDGLTNILDQYLSHSQDVMETVKLNRTTFDLNRLADQVINDMKGLHRDHIFCKTTNSKIAVSADRYLILQVLINYLTNAVKYSPKGTTITIAIKTKGDKIDLSVADQGTGIDKAEELLIFDRFYKTDPKKTTSCISKGLGLNMVKQLVELHDGKAFVKKAVSGGSVFHFTLPKSI